MYSLGMLFVLALGVRGQEEPSCICLEEVTSARGLRNPTNLRHAGDGSDRRFISEQVGLVWIFLPDGSRMDEPFLNITEIVDTSDRPGDERGFLSLAFHPQFSDNGRLYIYYSLVIEGDMYSRLSEVLVSSDNPNKVDPATERILGDFMQPFANHNGGDLLFDEEGLLHFFLGDGGLAGDPFDNSQNKGTYLGKALRVDVDSRTGELEYGIPGDNPFLDDPEAVPELYGYGLRNPWRVSMDAGDRVTGNGRGRIFIGDVGQSAFEEIDILESGGNYAWPAREGFTCYRQALCGNIGPEVFPIHAYSHRDTGRCIISGHVYRGCMNPAMNGWFFFGDFVNGKLFRLLESEPDVWTSRQLLTCDTCPEGLTNQYEISILSWGVDEQGEHYFTTTANPSPFDPVGAVYKIVDPFNRGEPCSA